MNIDKIRIKLDGVPQTLLLPLLGRAKFSEKSYSPIHDARAVQLVESIDYDFETLLPQIERSLSFWMARVVHFDDAIRNYLNKNPNGTIVSLGAGLETAFYRVDNGKLQWIDLDLPEVIALRKKIFPANERIHSLAKSILDYSWIDDIKSYGNEFFFFAGGLFMYFTKNEVKSLFTEIAKRLPGSELIFDNVTPRGIYYANEMLKKAGMGDAKLQWGITDAKELETWSPQIKVANHMPYFRDLNKKNFPLFLKFKMFLLDKHNKNAIIHLKFNS